MACPRLPRFLGAEDCAKNSKLNKKLPDGYLTRPGKPWYKRNTETFYGCPPFQLTLVSRLCWQTAYLFFIPFSSYLLDANPDLDKSEDKTENACDLRD